jgi:AcrR family transcriptional regulator
LLDATERLMREEGYAAVTARRVAQKASINNHQVIYYYFGTHEDLLRAVFRRRAEQILENLRRVMQADNILRSLWDYYRHPNESWFGMEFMALANHLEGIRVDIASYGAKFRELEMKAISRHFAASGLKHVAPPAVMSLVLTSLSRVMAREAALGLSVGHDDVEAFIDDYLRSFDNPAGVRERSGKRPRKRKRAMD